jgi:hypothetical protein
VTKTIDCPLHLFFGNISQFHIISFPITYIRALCSTIPGGIIDADPVDSEWCHTVPAGLLSLLVSRFLTAYRLPPVTPYQFVCIEVLIESFIAYEQFTFHLSRADTCPERVSCRTTLSSREIIDLFTLASRYLFLLKTSVFRNSQI